MDAGKPQNILVLGCILGYATMEYLSRRYQTHVNASANDTKLEILMFLSLLSITPLRHYAATGTVGHGQTRGVVGAAVEQPYPGNGACPPQAAATSRNQSKQTDTALAGKLTKIVPHRSI